MEFLELYNYNDTKELRITILRSFMQYCKSLYNDNLLLLPSNVVSKNIVVLNCPGSDSDRIEARRWK